MDYKQFNNYLKDISKAMYKIIKDRGLLDQLTEDNQKNPYFFEGNLQKLVRKELAWLFNEGKYDQMVDLVSEAFSKIFLIRDPFKNYKRKGEKGAAPLENLLHLFWQRQLSAESQSAIKKYNREINETNMHPNGESSSSELFDTLLDTYNDSLEKEFTSQEMAEYEELVELVLKRIKTKENYETLKLIIDMLALGFSKSEIARTLGVSAVRVSHLLKPIKKAIEDVVYESGDEEFVELFENHLK